MMGDAVFICDVQDCVGANERTDKRGMSAQMCDDGSASSVEAFPHRSGVKEVCSANTCSTALRIRKAVSFLPMYSRSMQEDQGFQRI